VSRPWTTERFGVSDMRKMANRMGFNVEEAGP
jgi:hypothetical protein